MHKAEENLVFSLPEHLSGLRIDQALSEYLEDYSRSRIQQWIKDGLVTVDGQIMRPKEKIYAGAEIVVHLQTALAEDKVENWDAEAIPLNIIFEDEHIIIVSKPAGLVVHPGAGNLSKTLVNALLHHAPELSKLPRAGVIHRLDKDTSGVLVVCRSLVAHNKLTQLLQAREFNREYLAVVNGVMTAGGTIDAPIGRHPSQRTKMAVLPHSQQAKAAITHYRVEKRFRAQTLVKLKLETGRTHQIRVHLAYIKYPIVGDRVYGGRQRIPPQSSSVLIEALQKFPRQALHARTLGFIHPYTEEYVEWSVDIPEDMQQLINVLQQDLDESHGAH